MSEDQRTVEPVFAPEIAKSVALTSLSLSRSIIVPQAPEAGDAPTTRWAIFGHRIPGGTLLVSGDLLVHEDDWMVGATSMISLEFKSRTQLARATTDELRDAFPRIAEWLQSILYDAAALKARELIASVYPPPDIEIDISTQPADQITFHDFREDSDQGPDAEDETEAADGNEPA